MIRTLSLLSLVPLFGGSTHGHVLFRTGFENSAYTANQPLDGQDGWIAFYEPEAAVVVQDRRVARHGRRAVKCWGGSDLTPTNGLLAGLWYQQHELGATQVEPRVRVECDVRLDGPDTGSGPQDDLVSANLYAIDGPYNVLFVVSSTGSAFAFSNSAASGASNYQFETPIELGGYTRLAITLDYATFVATFEVDGVEVGTLPFGDGVTQQFFGGAIEFAAVDAPGLVDPARYTAYYDNFAVSARSRCH